MIVLVLKVEVLEGKKDEFIGIAKRMVKGSQQEAGNMEYNVYEDLDQANTVAFIEKWKDQAALDQHEKTAHFTDNIGKLKSLCAKPPIRSRFDIIEF